MPGLSSYQMRLIKVEQDIRLSLGEAFRHEDIWNLLQTIITNGQSDVRTVGIENLGRLPFRRENKAHKTFILLDKSSLELR